MIWSGTRVRTSAAADLTRHNTTGTYFIHIYSGNKLVAHTTVTVKSLPNR